MSDSYMSCCRWTKTHVLCSQQVKDALKHLSDDGRTLVDEPIRTAAAPDGWDDPSERHVFIFRNIMRFQFELSSGAISASFINS